MEGDRRDVQCRHVWFVEGNLKAITEGNTARTQHARKKNGVDGTGARIERNRRSRSRNQQGKSGIVLIAGG